MAKKALLDVLEQTIGKYVKNLDAETLNVAVWSGKIQLHALKLDVAAVNSELDRQAAEAPNLAVPFKVLSGSFESFEVDVPWSHLMSQSVVLRARGLNITIAPYDRGSKVDHLQAVVASENVRAEKTQALRLQLLKSSDDFRKNSNAVKKMAMSNAEGDSQEVSTFSSRLVRRIIENLQIEVTDVHVSLKDKDGAAGVVLKSLSLMTSDVLGKKSFVDRTAAENVGSLQNNFLYKKLNINGLGLYLDDSDGGARLLAINEDAEKGGQSDPSHQYVLKPLTFEAKLRQADSKVCVDYHKYHLSSELSAIDIDLSRDQMDLTRRILSKLAVGSGGGKGPLFPEYRPLTRVTKGNTKEWWKYALRSIGRLNGRRSWPEFLLAFKKRKSYIPLYKRHAHHKACSWMKPLDPDEVMALSAIELDRSISIEGIMTWRTIADAQMDKELQKHNASKPVQQKGMFSSIFGSRTETPAATKDQEEEPPVTLSVKELQELEAATRQAFEEDDLSQDSKLADVKFVLSSLKVNLLGYGQRKVAALDMGSLAMSFDANMDGAFSFDFKMSDLAIYDHATPRSLFPKVLQKSPYKKNKDRKELAAFVLHVEKNHDGDQKLTAKLDAFEAIASPVLVREMKAFLTPPQSTLAHSQIRQNPLLAQSMSGSVDLFYDATPGSMETDTAHYGGTANDMRHEKHPEKASDEWQNTLVEAWQQKTEKKSSLIIDIDIMAPVIIVPESCSKLESSLLAFDLGHLRIQYGSIDPAPKVVSWLNKNRLPGPDGTILDGASIHIEELKFFAVRANTWHECIEKNDMSSMPHVLKPISMTLDVGVDSRIGQSAPQICAFGVIPKIGVDLSPAQALHMFTAAQVWSTLVSEVSESADDEGMSGLAITENAPSTPSADRSSDGDSKENAPVEATKVGMPAEPVFPKLHVELDLENLSAAVLDNKDQPQVGATLVSVRASLTSTSDGGSLARLQMGYFWVFDHLPGNFTRRQRLIVHSSLPNSDLEVLYTSESDLLRELKKVTTSKSDQQGSSELADIFWKTELLDEGTQLTQNTLNAKFTSLYLHWNPKAIKNLVGAMEAFRSTMVFSSQGEQNSVIVPPDNTVRRRESKTATEVSPHSLQSNTRLIVSAEMKNLDIYLHSARDDFPLFVLSVARTSVNLTSSGAEQDINSSLQLGDLRMSTYNMGSTQQEYELLLGLVPGESQSLLNVSYFTGASILDENPDAPVNEDTECFAQVTLSPMRLIYIQSQILAISEYITEGVLGALTAEAAASASEAAKELAAQGSKEKIFLINASALHVVLPEAAYSSESLSIHAGRLSISHKILPEPNGARTQINLTELVLKDKSGNPLQQSPLQANLSVTLPADVGDMDDQAMVVSVEISGANFRLSKHHYQQIMSTVDKNMGDEDLFLRSGDKSPNTSSGDLGNQPPRLLDQDEDSSNQISHAGVAIVENPRRIYLTVNIAEISLHLHDADFTQPLVRIAAVDTHISVQKLPDLDKMTCEVILRNLLCEDQRSLAVNRQYTFLMCQKEEPEQEGKAKDLFRLLYSSEIGSSEIELSIGSPQMTLIPDAVSDIVGFFGSPNTEDTLEVGNDVVGCNSVDIQARSTGRNPAVETTLVETTLVDTKKHTLFVSHINIQTGQCQILLVDFGSQMHTDGSKNDAANQHAETIVIQGLFASKVSTTTDLTTGEQRDAEIEFNGDSVEVFSAFGKKLRSPIQILDPTSLSAHTSISTSSTGVKEIEIRAATLSHIDMVFSMHNAALLTSILSNLQDSLISEGAEDAPLFVETQGLTLAETQRIANLAQALERNADDSNTVSSDSYSDRMSIASDAPQSLQIDSKLQVKMTISSASITFVNDLQGLDEALFRFATDKMVAKGEVLSIGSAAGGPKGPLFDVELNASILADYFDSSLGLWSKLLTEPWEVSLKANRSQNGRFKSKRLSTTVDLESFPCSLSLSDQFLVSLASANQMWTIYSTVINTPLEGGLTENTMSSGHRRSIISSVARSLVTSLPYAIDNHSGLDLTFDVVDSNSERRVCPSGEIYYFRFEPPKISGYGGRRQYGQDVSYEKSVNIYVKDTCIELKDVDTVFGEAWKSHALSDGLVILTKVSKHGKTMLLHVSSCVEIKNSTLVPFEIYLQQDGKYVDVGLSKPSDELHDKFGLMESIKIDSSDTCIPSSSFNVPTNALRPFCQTMVAGGNPSATLEIRPLIDGHSELSGTVELMCNVRAMKVSKQSHASSRIDVTCRNKQGKHQDPLVLQVLLNYTLVEGNYLSVHVALLPRAILQNRLPLRVNVRTLMPHTYLEKGISECTDNETVYTLEQDAKIQIFTPGPSIAITAKPADMPVGGTPLGWMEGGWIDLPLVSEFQLPEPLQCVFPFDRPQPSRDALKNTEGNEFFIVEGEGMLRDLGNVSSMGMSRGDPPEEGVEMVNSAKTISPHAFFMTVCNYAVDHTGDLLFERFDEPSQRKSIVGTGHRSSTSSTMQVKPFGAFTSDKHHHRITLLPSLLNSHLRLVQLSMDHIEGMKRSMPFRIEETPISNGGVDSVSVDWENKEASGYFAHRKLIDGHQCEVHFIPEFYVFNGNPSVVLVHESTFPEVLIEPGKSVPLRVATRKEGLQLAFNFVELGCSTQFLPLGELGMKVAIIRSTQGVAIGSVAVQTAIDTQGNARLVVKIGDIKYGSKLLQELKSEDSLLEDDFIRYRVRWTALQITLKKRKPTEETAEGQAAFHDSLVGLRGICSPKSGSQSNSRFGVASSVNLQALDEPVATLSLQRFTVDYQRIFDERQTAMPSKERTQISIIAHEIQIKDESPGTKYPIVLGCSPNVSFMDLCVRTRGSLDADVIKVDLFDLNLAHVNGKSERIILNTDEEFIWKLLDVSHQILSASGEFGGTVWKLENDEKRGGYTIRIEESDAQANAKYTPPETDKLYNIALTRVSPIALQVSFRRKPQSSRYGSMQNVRGAHLLKYFTQRLKFTVDQAEFKFARYSDRTLRGPPDRLLESLMAVYMSRMKFKIVKLLSATSIQDWRFLASRDSGDDEFVEGDILRATGNLSGKTVDYVFKRAGNGIGNGISNASNALGNKFESTTGAIGAGRLGVGVNSVVSGVGDGMGSTISGVGAGFGKALKGSGQGLGQMVGGVTGGVLMVGKGIGKGIVGGDGSAVVHGFKQGGKSVGNGVGQGVESAVMGTADGVMTVGRGFFSGLKSVGKGIGGAVKGQKPPRRESKPK